MKRLTQDERLNIAPVRGDRARITFVLQGELFAFRGEQLHRARPGEALFVPRLGDVRTRGSSTSALELDMDSVESRSPLQLFRLSDDSNAAVQALYVALSEASENSRDAVRQAALRALDAFTSDEIPLSPKCANSLHVEPTADEQTLWAALDQSLERLDRHPDLTDLEALTGWTRRTLNRRITALSAKYRMYVGAEDWRAQRDFYRQIVAVVLLSHPDASPQVVSELVGYRSVAALCHAFQRAGLPAPSQIFGLLRQLEPTGSWEAGASSPSRA